MFQLKPKVNIPKWLLNTAIIFFIACLITASLYFIFEKKYQNKIYPGILIGEINLGGKTVSEANSLINEKLNSISQSGIAFHYQKKQAAITPTIASTDGSFAYQIISFNAEKSANQAYSFGKNNSFFQNLKNKISGLIYKRAINLSLSMNEKEIKNILMENFSSFETPAQDAKLIFDKQNNNFTVREEKLGKIMDYEKAIKRLGINLLNLNNVPIQLYTKTDYPEIYKKDCLNIESKAKDILSLAPVILIFKDKQWQIEKNQLAELLSLETGREAKNQNLVAVGLDKNAVEQFLEKEIAPNIDEEPISAKFEIKDGRVAKFQASQDGIKLKIKDSFIKINSTLINYSLDGSEEVKIELIVKILKSPVNTNDVNNLGINKIIGTGESNFSGSPRNRRHNIKTGADALNG
ncbi:peptidoglycan binding domain-containing protein, partial [Candidatus Parcubacteria bacterium]|nr:peptidoglycan binding domain-containing protein [Candidatus Parcubacteria bacterium]